MTATAVQRLQGTAGNRATARLLAPRRSTPPARPTPVQRLASGPDTAAATRAGADADPKFATLKSDVQGKQKLVGKHPPASAEATASQAAAKAPQDDKEAQGKAANAEKMNAAKPGEFNKAAFIRAVNEAIAAQAPKNLDEADNFGDSGKAAAVKGQVQGQVGEGKKASAGPIESTTKAPPDTSKAKDKPVTPLKPDQPPPTPGTPDPALAVPDKAPPSATDFSAGPKQVDNEMAQAEVTEGQLAKSNEPEFANALQDKKEGEQHAATAPGQVRAAEAKTLAGAKGQAAQAGATAMTALATDRRQAGSQVAQGKESAKSKDESQRAEVTAKLRKVFDATKKDVEGILSGLDKQVDEKFATGEKSARDAFTAEHKRRMDEYKEKRYGGWVGKGRWLKDKFTGLPEEANQIFVQARKGYVDQMQQVISVVADLVGGELNKAKQRIATGRTELQAAVASLSPELQSIGKQAAGEFAGKFDELTESVDAKGTELVQTLATKYNDALKSVDEEIDAEKEKNKGFVAKAVDAVKGVIDTILKLKDLLLGVLAKAASAVAAIIKDPIAFLGKLVSAVGSGLHAFLANIGEHLKKGLIGWLMGAMASAGLELPAKFDLRGIIMMVGSLLGLTWGAIKGRVISRGVPAQAVDTVEKTVPIAQKLQSEGIGGIWEQIKEKVGDLKANLFAKISEYLIPAVLMAGITWIISLLNPASAFIKACKMIVDIVTFIIERGAQIIEFVNSVLDAVIAIAGGAAGGIPALIEKALAKSIPVLIGALAAILGIGGIADKVKKFFQSLSKPVMKAVDWVVDKIVNFGKKIWAKLKAGAVKLRDRVTGRNRQRPGSSSATPTGRLNADAVKAKASRELKAAIGPRFSSASDVKAKVNAIFQNNRPLGVKTIAVKPMSKVGEFAVLVSASAAKVATKFVHTDFKVGIRISETRATEEEALAKLSLQQQELARQRAARRLGPRRTVQHTALTANWNGTALPRQMSRAGVHAEVFLDRFIRKALINGALQRHTHNVLDIQILKSPCPACGSVLSQLASDTSASIHLAMVGLYHGEQEERDPVTGKKVTNAAGKPVQKSSEQKRKQKERSIEVLKELKKKGFKLSVLSVEQIIHTHYEDVVLDDQERATIARKARTLQPIIDKINADENAVEMKAGG